MMNKMNSAGKAPYKVLFALPLMALLALVLAEPKVILAQEAANSDGVKNSPVLMTDKKTPPETVDKLQHCLS
jgi:hypothetical protein